MSIYRAVAVISAFVLSLAVLSRPAHLVSAGPTIAFEAPSIVDPIQTNGEPDIGVSPQGQVFVSGPTGTGTQRSTWYGSVDGGHTYRVITPGVPPSGLTSIEDPPGGGDTDINFDRSGKQYFADLYALACLRTATTSDGGATVFQSTLGGCLGSGPGADRQWLAVYDPPPNTPKQSPYTGPTPLIYLEYNNLDGPGPNSGAQWNMSNASVDPAPGGPGLNYVDALAGSVPGTGAVYTPFGPDGYPAIDQQTGKIFQTAGFRQVDGSYSLLLNIGTPDSSGKLTFLDAPTSANPQGDPSKLIHVADHLPGSPDTLFSVASMDSARNLFVTWATGSSTPSQRQVYVSVASAAGGWTQWSTPVQVSDASTATGDAVNVFPWIKAGGPGRAAAVWYGSNLNVDPSSQNGQAWNVFMSQVVFPTDSTGAVTGAPAAVTLVKATPHPMHYNDICLAGTDCIQSQGNRNLADFFQVNIDRSGAAEIVYDDTSNGLVQPGFTPDNTQLVDHAGAPQVTVLRQSSGPGLYGSNVSGPSNAPVGGLNDPAGDALYPVIGGTTVPGMDVLGNSLRLSSDGKTLDVSTRIVDLAHPAATATAIAGTAYLQYVTRWQLGNTIYYAAMENTAADQPIFYAGKAQSVDLCSVSACFPHVLTYPEPSFGGVAESGTINCPATPSAGSPCTLTVHVNVADVGAPTASSLLEEVGSYGLVSSHQQGVTTNAQAQADNIPLQIDGVCCYNFNASVANGGLPPCHEGDGNGAIHGKNGGSGAFSFDADPCQDNHGNSVQETDPSTGTNFQSTQVMGVTFDDGSNSVTIVGAGTDNGQPVTFTMVAVGGVLGLPGTFSLTLSDGYAVNSSLLSGSISLQ